MRRMIRRKNLGSAVLTTLILSSGLATAGTRTAFVSPGFASCAVDFNCPPLSCDDSRFQLEGSCSAACSDSIPSVSCYAGIGSQTTTNTWQVDSLAALFLPGGDTPTIQATFSAVGTRLSPELLTLDGQIDLYVLGPPGDFFIQQGGVEFSVFRFTGDPASLDGVDVCSVSELVSLGLVDADDLLFSETIDYPLPPDQDGFNISFSFPVNVTGVPDDELVVFASELDAVYVPAVSTWSAVGLAVLMLGIASYARRNVPARQDGPPEARGRVSEVR